CPSPGARTMAFAIATCTDMRVPSCVRPHRCVGRYPVNALIAGALRNGGHTTPRGADLSGPRGRPSGRPLRRRSAWARLTSLAPHVPADVAALVSYVRL